MKKIKILLPILSISAIAAVTPAVANCSCSKQVIEWHGGTDNIAIDFLTIEDEPTAKTICNWYDPVARYITVDYYNAKVTNWKIKHDTATNCAKALIGDSTKGEICLLNITESGIVTITADNINNWSSERINLLSQPGTFEIEAQADGKTTTHLVNIKKDDVEWNTKNGDVSAYYQAEQQEDKTWKVTFPSTEWKRTISYKVNSSPNNLALDIDFVTSGALDWLLENDIIHIDPWILLSNQITFSFNSAVKTMTEDEYSLFRKNVVLAPTKVKVIAQNWATGKSYRTPFDGAGNLLMIHVKQGSYPSLKNNE